MLIRKVITFLALLAWPAMLNAQTLDGWSAVVSAIQNTPANQIDQLNGRTFSLRLEGASGRELEVRPPEAFSVEGSGTNWVLRITNAAALLEDAGGGLLVKRSISWRAEIAGDDDFGLELEGVGNCQFSVNFRQVGASELDLSQLRSDFNVSWTFNSPALVENAEIRSAGLLVQRKRGTTGTLEVVLRARNASGTVDAKSAPVTIPLCGEYVPDSGSTTSIVQLRSPSQCMIPLGTRMDAFTAGGQRGQRFRANYANTCDRPIRCEMTWRMLYYQNDSDYEALRNGELVATHNEEETWTAGQVREFDFEISAPNRTKPAFWTGHFVPDRALPTYQNSDYVCVWQ